MEFGIVFLLIMFFIFLISIPLSIIIIRKITSSNIDSDCIVELDDGSKTDGCVIGNLIEKKTGRNGRLHLKFIPRDSKTFKEKNIIVEPNKVLVYPKGVRSREKAIIRVLPESAQDYVNNVLKDIEIKNAENSIIYAQKMGLLRQQSHLSDMGEGELSEVNLGLKNDYIQNVLKTSSKEEKPKVGSYQQNKDVFMA